MFSYTTDIRLVEMHQEGLAYGKGARRESVRFRVRPRCLHWHFSGPSHTSDLNIGTAMATQPAPDVLGSVLILVSPVSEYFDW